MKINNTNQNLSFKSISPLIKPLGAFYNANSIVPTLLIESGVTSGRSYEANKRGGKKEATERLTEQGISALVWVFGVQALKKIGDFIGKNIFNIENLDFDLGKDILRNPVKNNNISKLCVGYKAGNILVSTAIATYFIGFVLPKLTHKISSKVKNEKTSNNDENISKNMEKLTFEEFKNKTKKTDLSFKGFTNVIQNLSYSLENNAVERLLITDIGVVSGRFKNGRNKYERIENLFRDVSSIYFYLFCSKHTVSLLNKMTNSKNINPKALSEVVSMLKDNIDCLNKDNFIDKVIGKNAQKEAIEKLFEGKEIVSADDFIKQFGNSEKALDMAKLQPIFDGNGVLDKIQANDVLNDGLTTNPKFLNRVYNAATNGKSSDKLKFVSKKELDGVRKNVDDFVLMIDEQLKNSNQELSKELIDKVANKYIVKNFGFNAIGLMLSTFALAILIPRVQYLITQKLTNKREFVGDMVVEK